ncbi:hypothetical protein [Thioalbus denitrificans]|uniref:Uncharacterized protein n=1 Tax=Thioalbus denitrificans TaxID=547122 RepID=A0A369CF03_9GAMM|nr:hypothetical protein [Thioalbus denitrificans]RCX31685.1 hypothetical protein DFQ59_10228 [Thioalbus denitrificans]
MSDPVSHFSQRAPSEQAPNRVRSGFDAAQLFEKMDEVALCWREHDRLDVVLLRAICRLSLENPGDAEEGFTSPEIVHSVAQLRGRAWSSDNDTDRMSDDVRRYWNKLLATWEVKKEGIIQHFGDCGFGFAPHLDKAEGGGSGRPSRYRIHWMPIDSVSEPESWAGVDVSAPFHDRSIRYICEDIEDAGLSARLFVKGYEMTGWRKWVMLTLVGIPVLFLVLSAAVFLMGFSINMATLEMSVVLRSLIILGGTYWVTHITIGPILNVASARIVLAPWWMQSINDDRLLELQYPPRHPQKAIKAVRYTATCPLCGGAVSTRSGGLEFWGRIVGRCEHAPKEHVFSFDHVTRKGKAFRF